MEAASAAAAADMTGTAGAAGEDNGSPARRATVPPDKGVVGDRTRPRKREAVSMVWAWRKGAEGDRCTMEQRRGRKWWCGRRGKR